ncbi:DUF4320 family protein (plasmid) [Oscillospiraceae bacterium MB08-C2-2]|nr:DUF4320 family protein [Oscillospiraceae bacterium MB08-C2-2]
MVMLILAMVAALILSVVPVLVDISTTDRIANDLARFMEVRGDTENAQSEFDRLTSQLSLEGASLSVDATTISGSTHIQMDDEFTVTITTNSEIGIGGLIKLPITLSRKATGRSEKYWK